MKKLSLILIAALVALSFMGCPTANTDLSWDILKPACFNSSQGNLTITYADAGTSAIGTVEFTFNASDTSWGAHPTDIEFGICSDTSWTSKWVDATLTVGGGYQTTTLGGANNNKVAGLVDGQTYVVTLLNDASTVKVKIDAK